ncbi:MAG: ABC transporter ATP-binding protein [Spirochaetae bacterium HGW-Spirochaetae-8]|jgi:iron(III) transport system ATP-binding protein|nr:MAG: ABC transporter ATP-binding protein [Spirochaetae bacterium HGW-Spirochaetae-8]
MQRKNQRTTVPVPTILDAKKTQYLVLQNLTKVFHNANGHEVRAVDGFSLSVGKGEFITLIGPSGCGKSTTLRMIAGFERPTSGEIIHEGLDITHADPQDRSIPIVFQNYALFPHMNVFENLAYGLRARYLPQDAINHDVAMICQMVNLVGIENRFPHELSDGQQQRVALARALVLKPKLILFDEPLSNLDARLRLQTRSEIKRMQQMLGITVLYVTHDQSEALSLPDRVVIMNRGKIVQIGTPEQVYHDPASLFVSDFISNANFLDAIVVSIKEGIVVIAMNERQFSVPAERCDGNPEPGDRVMVSINPETIGIRKLEGVPLSERITGVVELSSFNGPFSEYKVTFGETLIRVVQPNIRGRTMIHKVGQEVVLTFEVATFRVFPAQW